MRALADGERIRTFMRALGAAADAPAQIYLTGGATAVLVGWRATTIDVDLKIVPEADRLLRAIPALKERLGVNVELASPADFLPVAPGWEERSPFVSQEGPLTFRHFDPYAQALAKIERGHTQDLDDVGEMIRRKLVDPAELQRHYHAIEGDLYRFPAISPSAFRQAVERFLAG